MTNNKVAPFYLGHGVVPAYYRSHILFSGCTKDLPLHDCSR